jgi:hypothetical protein
LSHLSREGQEVIYTCKGVFQQRSRCHLQIIDGFTWVQYCIWCHSPAVEEEPRHVRCTVRHTSLSKTPIPPQVPGNPPPPPPSLLAWTISCRSWSRTQFDSHVQTIASTTRYTGMNVNNTSYAICTVHTRYELVCIMCIFMCISVCMFD